MWCKIKAACLHSLTIAWGYVLAAAGAAMSMIDNVGNALGDPNLKHQIKVAIGDPQDRGTRSARNLDHHDPGAAKVASKGKLNFERQTECGWRS
ncbi:MAG: hypothetical protein ACREDL_01840 [Bradyrhizobium sp.]